VTARCKTTPLAASTSPSGSTPTSNITTGGNNIDIGNAGVAGESNTIRVGGTQTKTFIAGIRGAATGIDVLPVLVDSNGQLGTLVSSERFKKDIQPMDNASDAVLALKPVKFCYKNDTTKRPQFGLIVNKWPR
jgi:hypothetical protein